MEKTTSKSKKKRVLVLIGFTGCVFLTLLIGLIVAMVLVFRSMVLYVDPTEAVIVETYERQSYRLEVLPPGTYFRWPGKEYYSYDITRQTYEMSRMSSPPDSVEVRTSDGQTYYVDLSVTYSLDRQKIIQIHETWRNRYKDLVRPISRSITREVCSRYASDEMIVSRDEINQIIADELAPEFEKSGLILSKVEVLDIYLSMD
jgi:regulator of protease activity HflC (stomatin/prohibitin superfamily)